LRSLSERERERAFQVSLRGSSLGSVRHRRHVRAVRTTDEHSHETGDRARTQYIKISLSSRPRRSRPAIADARRRRRSRRPPAPRARAAPRARGRPRGPRGGRTSRCKRATARTVTEHGARRGRAARDRSSDRPTATRHGRRAMAHGHRAGRALRGAFRHPAPSAAPRTANK
jgi:hypothetical protein